MERMQKQQNQAVENSSNDSKSKTKATDVSATEARLDEVLEQANKVMYGSEEAQHQLAGKSVAEIRKYFRAPMNIPTDAQARIDGKAVDESTVLQQGQTLEFVKVSGQKG